MGAKPELKIAIKSVTDGGKPIHVLAFWRGDNGKLRGSLDRAVKGIRVYMEDGTHHDVKRLEDGKKHNHWIDAYSDEPQRAPAPSGGGDFADGDDEFGSIPFVTSAPSADMRHRDPARRGMR